MNQNIAMRLKVKVRTGRGTCTRMSSVVLHKQVERQTSSSARKALGPKVDSRRMGIKVMANRKEQVAIKTNLQDSQVVQTTTSSEDEDKMMRMLGQAALISTSMLALPEDAFAKGGELGILEGRTIALLHPAMMAFLLGATVWSGWLGWQWRRVRTIQTEINELKTQLPAPAADGTAVISPLQTQIDSLTEVCPMLSSL